ncbi:MAG: hypothetical protein AAGG68_13335, partial [Bacteroidota bacterium]
MRTILTTLILTSFHLLITAQSLEQLPLDSLIQWVSDNAYCIYENENTEEVHSYAYQCLMRAKKEAEITKIIAASQNLALLHYLIEDKNVPDSSL